MKIAFSAAIRHKVNKIIIFTAEGVGVKMALEEFLCKPEYAAIRIVAVRFPVGKRFSTAAGEARRVDFSDQDKASFRTAGIPIIRANLPFDTIAPHLKSEGRLGQDFGFISNALDVFGGGMSLCVQATMLACDAGEIDEGEHVISMTADTAILSRAATTSHFLTDFIVREILCKPAVLTVIKNEEPNAQQINLPLLSEPETKDNQPLLLPASNDDNK